MSKQPFNESPAIPLAPAKSQIVPGVSSGQPQIAVSNSSTQKTWRVLNEDIRLATTFDRWAREAGYRLIWDARKHVLLSAGDSFVGTFEGALDRALSSPAILKSEYPLEACFYPNNPPIVRITRLGEQTEQCPQ